MIIFDLKLCNMIQMCCNYIVPLLKLITEPAMKLGNFSAEKGKYYSQETEQNLIKNYRPLLLLSIFAKIFDKVIFNNLFAYFQENKLLSVNKSSFRS